MLSFLVIAQNEDIKKKDIKKSVKVELVNNSNQLFKGCLYYADSGKIVISDSYKKMENFYLFKPSDIKQIETKQKGKFINTALVGFLATTTVLSTYSMFESSENMLGGFVVVIIGVVYGIPSGIASGLIFGVLPANKLEIYTDSKTEQYNIILPYLSNKSMVTELPENMIFTDKKPYSENVVTSDKKTKYFHPLNYPKFSLNLDINQPINNILWSVKRNYKSNGFEYSNTDYDFSSICITADYNINNKFKPYFSYQFENGFRTFGQKNFYIEENYITDYSVIEINLSSVSLGSEYLFKSVNNMLLSKSEISIGAGIKADFAGYISSVWSISADSLSAINEDIENYNFKTFGIELSGTYRYHLTRFFSLNAGLKADFLLPVKINEHTAYSINNRIFTVPEYNLNLSSVYFKFGLGFHF